MNLMDRIEINPEVCSGKPVIRGTRIMVANILGMAAEGYIIEQMIADFPRLTPEDISAALRYAAQVVSNEQVLFA